MATRTALGEHALSARVEAAGGYQPVVGLARAVRRTLARAGAPTLEGERLARDWLVATAVRRFITARAIPESAAAHLLSLAPALPDVSPVLAANPHALADAPDIAPYWARAETTGWLAQYAGTQPRRGMPRTLNAGRKADHAALVRATQVYTPDWIASFLAANTLGRLWLAMHPDSRIASRLPSLVPLPDAPWVAPKLARDIRVLDPSCGAMHLGCAAFAVLAEMYREECDRAGEPGWPRVPSVRDEGEIAASILAHNLAGIDVSEDALRLAALTLSLKAHTLPHTDAHVHEPYPMPRLASAAGLALGSLTPASALPEDAQPVLAALLAERVDVVLTNPPYLDSRAFPSELRTALRSHYPDASRNLYAAFLARGVEWLGAGGRLGILTPQTYLFLASFSRLRASLRERAAIETLSLLGYGAFAQAVVDCAACVLRREPDADRRARQTGVYFKLDAPPTADEKRLTWERALETIRAGKPSPTVTLTRPQPFDRLPGSPWVFWHETPPAQGADTSLGTLARVAVGLQTGDNARFLRYWWEVGRERIAWDCADGTAAHASGARWFPHAKGGEWRRWWGNRAYVVNWQADGAEVRALGRETGRPASRAQNVATYFRAGITWTHTSRKGLSVRLLPAGTICNVEAVAAFPYPTPDATADETALLLLALLNTPAAERRIARLNPTVHFGTREVAALPIPTMAADDRAALVAQARRAIDLARAEAAEDETDPDFRTPPAWPPAPTARAIELRHIEDEIATRVSRLYADTEPTAPREDVADQPPLPSQGADARAAGKRQEVARERDGAAAKRSEGPGVGLPERQPHATALCAHPTDPARRWLSYAVGLAFGRYTHAAVDASMVLPNEFAPLDPKHPDDLAQRVRRILGALVGDDAERVMLAATDGQPLATWLGRQFFRWHLARYRRRPIYWLIESPRRAYAAYLFYPRASAASLPLLRAEAYLGHALASAHGRAADDLRAFTLLLDEVIGRRDDRGATVGWAPEPDDGVLVSAAPLAALLPAWRAARPSDLTACWEALATGALDWSRTAARYWPERVAQACQTNASYALAHSLRHAR